MLRSPTYKYFRKKPNFSNLPSPAVIVKNLQLAMCPGISERRHIFVVGPPRNGTTLIQKIFVSHPDLSGPDTETFFFLKKRLDGVRIPEIPNSKILEHFHHSKSKAQFFDLIVDEFIKNGKRFVEKSPEHALVMPEILNIFPNSKIIFIYRDGRDAYISAMKHEGVRSKIGENYPLLWSDSMRALEFLKSDARVLPIRYEDLCQYPVKTLRGAVECCGLEFREDMIDPETYSQTEYSRKKEHKRLREKISAKTVGIHRLPENRESRDKFERVGKEMLCRFGYYVNEGE